MIVVVVLYLMSLTITMYKYILDHVPVQMRYTGTEVSQFYRFIVYHKYSYQLSKSRFHPGRHSFHGSV